LFPAILWKPKVRGRGHSAADSQTLEAEPWRFQQNPGETGSVKSDFIRAAFLLCALIVPGSGLYAQIPASQTAAPKPADPLGRTSPQESMLHFLEACHAKDYTKAAHYLDLRHMPPADVAKQGPALATQLEDLLDDTPFDITALSRDPEGDTSDGLDSSRERLDTFHVDGQDLELQLERVQLRPGLRVWLVAADSLPLIPQAHQLIQETGFEKRLPQPLVTFELFDTPVWRWIVLILAGLALWAFTPVVAWGAVRALRPVLNAPALKGPFRILLAVTGLRVAIEFAPPATLARLFVERALALVMALGLAWAAAVFADLFAERWRKRLDPRMHGVSLSFLPLGRQVVKLSLYVFAVLSVISAWGYNTSTILAGLGVGGLAVALAAQKTIENLFGGISVIGDRPVLVGDVCKFGDHTGTVLHIGLRSTRIQTADRTIISIPNSQFSSMPLENLSRRDKIWFHPVLNLRRDTTSEQLLKVLSGIASILKGNEKVETGDIPVRFIGVGPYSLDVEVVAYVRTANNDEFLALQQDLLLRMLRAVEEAGTALAVPVQEVAQRAKA
jgi:MscS family membrane protein